jgi:hypothetical protein
METETVKARAIHILKWVLHEARDHKLVTAEEVVGLGLTAFGLTTELYGIGVAGAYLMMLGLVTWAKQEKAQIVARYEKKEDLQRLREQGFQTPKSPDDIIDG